MKKTTMIAAGALLYLLATLPARAQLPINVTGFKPAAGSGGFPANAILDNFNRANEGPPLSANWTTLIGGLTVDTNKALAGFGHQAEHWSVGTFAADQETYMTLTDVPADVYRMGVLLRGAADGDGYYVAAFSDGAITVWLLVNGSLDTAIGASFNQAVADGDSIGATIIGNTITVYYKPSGGAWTSLGARTDATYAGAGYIGMRFFSYNGLRVDDFGGGAL